MRGRRMALSAASVTLVLLASSLASVTAACYWNEECPYLLYSSKTPYNTIRGDIRDHATPQNCQAVSIWSLNRHGNRNPSGKVTQSIKAVASLQDEIVAAYEAGRSQLCAQDIQDLREWTWNETLEVTQNVLTHTGYKEQYDIASRLREKYSHLLLGSASDYYFRPTNEQRTTASARAFVRGLTDGSNLTLTPDPGRRRDDVIETYQHCRRYQKTVRVSQLLQDQMRLYYSTPEYSEVGFDTLYLEIQKLNITTRLTSNVQEAVQQRLGIVTQLTADQVYALYDICRFERSWTLLLQSPWCAVFSHHDLQVLEYKDDVRHFYWNSYGNPWINARLGGPTLKDLYENFEASIKGQGRKIVAYFTHDTMLEMVYCAMGIFRDAEVHASYRDPSRRWRTSLITPFSANVIAVLNRCEESGRQTYRVQIFVNEKETELCPLEGCTWRQFQEKFEVFKSAELHFCSIGYREPQAVHEKLKDVWIMILALLKLFI